MRLPVYVTVFLLFAVVTIDLRSSSVEMWRNSESGAANTLYIALRCNGIGISYSQVRDALNAHPRPQSASAIVDVGKKCGLELQLRILTYKELLETRTPVITFLDGMELGTADYCIYLRTARAKVFFVNGPFAYIKQMTAEEFRRK